MKITRATPHCAEIFEKASTPGAKTVKRITSTRMPAHQISISTSSAIKRLPMPASGISISTSSGVSMLSWSEFISMAQILSNQWILKRRPHWDRLSALLAQCDASGLGQLSRAELQELALLYRQVASDFSVLRQDSTSRTYAQHVNQLLARAHHIIYSGRKASLLTLFRFLRDEYPAIFQRQIGYVAASVLVFLSFGIIGAAITNVHLEFMRTFASPEMIATMERHTIDRKSTRL